MKNRLMPGLRHLRGGSIASITMEGSCVGLFVIVFVAVGVQRLVAVAAAGLRCTRFLARSTG